MSAVPELGLGALERTRQRILVEPESGRERLTTVTRWTAGAMARTQARQFRVETDEPQALGGTDQAADPLELLMAALGSCLTIGWVKQCQRRGVTLRRVAVTVEAGYDLRGYLDLDADVRPGLQGLHYTVEVDCDADAETLAAIKSAAERTSPLFDNIFNGTAVRGDVRALPPADAPV